MRSHQRRLFGAVTLFIGLAVLGGCSSSKKAAAPSVTTAPTAPAAVTPTTVKATGGGLCAQLASYINSASSLGTSPSPGEVQASFTEGAQLGQEALNEAPAALKPDLQIILTATSHFVTALAAVNYNLAALPASATSSTIGTPAVLAADAKVDAYLKNTCGIAIPGAALNP
jgi:hypothetical protein